MFYPTINTGVVSKIARKKDKKNHEHIGQVRNKVDMFKADSGFNIISRAFNISERTVQSTLTQLSKT